MKNIIHHSVLTIIVTMSISSCSHLGYDLINKKQVNLPSFDSNYRYKRLVINKNNEVWIASSSLDDAYKPVDYYSADSGVVTFNNNRLVGYSTPKPIRSWSEQATPFSWKKLIQGSPQLIRRCIIDHPQNTVDHCQSRVLRVIDTAPVDNQLVTRSKVLWVQEMPQSKYYKNDKQNIYYAIRKRDKKPIYGQLYLDDDTQVTWQDWGF